MVAHGVLPESQSRAKPSECAIAPPAGGLREFATRARGAVSRFGTSFSLDASNRVRDQTYEAAATDIFMASQQQRAKTVFGPLQPVLLGIYAAAGQFWVN